MTAVWLVVGLVVGLAVGAVAATVAERRRHRRRRAALEARAADLEADAAARVKLAEERATVAEGRVGAESRRADEAERDATDARARADAERDRAERAERRERTEVQLAAASGGTIDATWSLAALRVAWDQRHAAALVPAMRRDGAIDLVEAARAEVERIREEIGTPGVLDVPDAASLSGLGAAPSLLALVAVGTLLTALARRAEAYDLGLARDDGFLRAEVTCDADDGIAIDDPDLADVVAAVALAGADLHLRRRSDGRFCARLELPLH